MTLMLRLTAVPLLAYATVTSQVAYGWGACLLVVLAVVAVVLYAIADLMDEQPPADR